MNEPYAKLVYDGGDKVVVPTGEPRADQLQGTPLEQLAEIAGRTCYDSLGVGRSSTEYHKHIIEVGHLSVYEHCPLTMRITGDFGSEAALFLLNRPGVFIYDIDDSVIEFSCNIRTILDWNSFSKNNKFSSNRYESSCSDMIHHSLMWALREIAPQIFSIVSTFDVEDGSALLFDFSNELLTPRGQSDQWVSLYLYGSRGMSHEQVRHGDFTAISQRSTRYVDESGSNWVPHPLLKKYDLLQGSAEYDQNGMAYRAFEFVKFYANTAYDELVAFLTKQGIQRKQARGAARGVLGNALATELIFSASVDQWHRMIGQRGTEFADAEIRQMYVGDGTPDYPCVLSALLSSRYGESFKKYKLKDSPDGIGVCLA